MHSFLADLKPKCINSAYKDMCRPFEFDSSAQIIDYNWQVDIILKSSHPYDTQRNKGKKGGDTEEAKSYSQEKGKKA
jgi:hypothetical protein